MRKQRAVVVTGASSGIGEATALRLALNGRQVFAGVRREADGIALARRAGENVVPLALDGTDAASIAAARKSVTESLAGEQPDPSKSFRSMRCERCSKSTSSARLPLRRPFYLYCAPAVDAS